MLDQRRSFLLSAAILIALLFLTSGNIFAQEIKKFQFVVTVISADSKEPVAGATVHANRVTKIDNNDPTMGGDRDNATTDFYGQAYLRFANTGTYIIKVEHDDYQTQEKWVPSFTSEKGIPVNFSLSRKKSKDKKLIVINLAAQDNNLPIEGAKIFLDGGSFFAISSGTTNSEGTAFINISEGNKFSIQITHSFFKPFFKEISLIDGAERYSFNYKMKRKNAPDDEEETERKLVIGVNSKKKNGEIVPVESAKLTLPDGQVKFTDSKGRCEVTHTFKPDQTITIQVEATNYKSQSVSHQILKSEMDNNLVRDVLTVTLVSNEPSEDLDRWTGTWLGKGSVFTISADADGVLYGSYNYNLPGVYWGNAKGNGIFSSGVIKDGTVTCDWKESHEDDDKTYDLTGKVFFTLYGKILHVKTWITVDTKVNWKAGHAQYDVTEIGKGGGSQSDLERPKN